MKACNSKLPHESLRIVIRGLSRTPHPTSHTPHFTPPRGLTLIEVLISMFVLLIGLLGVGMICQLGRLTLTETAKYDRAAACGRAGLREVRIRRMLDVTNWRDVNGKQIPAPAGPSTTPNYNGAINVSPTFDPMDSYCIDPLLIGQVALFAYTANSPANLTTIDRFPACQATTTSTAPPPVCTMKRITLGVTTGAGPVQTMPPYYTSSSIKSNSPVAARIFSWRDDLAFDTTYVPKLRPQRIYRAYNSGSGGIFAQPGFEAMITSPQSPYLPLPRGTPLYAETDLSQQAQGGVGGYSWMVTITPAYQEMALLGGSATGPPLSWSDHHLYMVSVVVFYKRDLTLPVCSNGNLQTTSLSYDQSECSERIVNVTFRNPTGYGGGDVTLVATSNNAKAPGDFFKLKRDDWLLLCGQVNVQDSADPGTGNTTISNPASTSPKYAPVNYFRWYRVVAMDDSNASINNPNDSTAQYKRNVTLAGPDWPNGTGIMSGPVVAVLVNGVVGVYSDVTTLESNRLWASAP